MQKLFQFEFLGRIGYVFEGNFVRWGDMSFQLEAASPELRQAIEQARSKHNNTVN
jgi:hypothetical protein